MFQCFSDDCTRRTLIGLEPNYSSDSNTPPQAASRWSAVIGLLAFISLYLVLPERLTLGPTWLIPALALLLLVTAVISNRAGLGTLNFTIGIALLLVVTVAEIWSLWVLIAGLPIKRQLPAELLRSAAALWFSNILVFASWYWRLDAGGTHKRDARISHTEGSFLFPQMTLPPDSELVKPNWKPDFIDYLFLAFNTSTAFSPTDAPVLSRWAKLLMMIQSTISLGTLAILAARAINVL